MLHPISPTEINISHQKTQIKAFSSVGVATPPYHRGFPPKRDDDQRDGNVNLDTIPLGLEKERGGVRALKCPKCGSIGLYRGCFCGDRFKCPYCRKKRERRFKRMYVKALERFRFPAFLTLTLKRRGGIKEDVKRLRKGFQRFRRRKEWRKRIKAYFGVVEITKGNVHIHLIVDCIWFEQEEISDIWREITGDYVVDIRRIRDKKKAIDEIFKYVLKDYGMDEGELEEIREALKGVRLVMASKGLPLSSLDTSEISEHQSCPVCGEKMKFWKKIEDISDIISEKNVYFWTEKGWFRVYMLDYKGGKTILRGYLTKEKECDRI